MAINQNLIDELINSPKRIIKEPALWKLEI